MKTVNNHLYITLTFLIILFTTESSAVASETFQPIELSGEAFRCSLFARDAKLAEEDKRLFSYGYEKGKVAVKSIRKESTRKNTSTGLSYLFNFGVDDDFLLGIIYWKSAERVSKFLLERAPVLGEQWERAAKAEFFRRNCQLIGK